MIEINSFAILVFLNLKLINYVQKP